jgi:hypothetical protein
MLLQAVAFRRDANCHLLYISTYVARWVLICSVLVVLPPLFRPFVTWDLL